MAATAPDPAAPTGAGEGARLSEAECAELRVRLCRAVARICPPWLASQADDIAQRALIRLVQILERREGEARLGASYVRKAAYTATVDEVRRRRRQREVALEAGGGEQASAGPDPERLRAAVEIDEALRDCLGRMVEGRRRAVTLHLLGHSVPEASRILGWSNKQVENLVYRGLADLRRCLVGKGFAR